jgi:hypothetical protein
MLTSQLAGSALLFVISLVEVARAGDPGQWTPAKADQWYASQPWLVGSNFIPSTAINELEMWQADTFDPAYRSGLGWASPSA